MAGTWLYIYLKFVVVTSRIRVVGPAAPPVPNPQQDALGILGEGRPAIFTFWHGRSLPFLYLFGRKSMGFMVSLRRKKDPLVRCASCFGLKVAEGSLDGGGRHALMTLMEHLKKGHQVALPADSSRGEGGQCRAGPFILAQESGAPLVPCSWHAAFSFRYRSKDAPALAVPLPFNRITVKLGAPLFVAKHYKFDELESVKNQLKASLDRLENA